MWNNAEPVHEITISNLHANLERRCNPLRAQAEEAFKVTLAALFERVKPESINKVDEIYKRYSEKKKTLWEEAG
jgi:hypothetical protein